MALHAVSKDFKFEFLSLPRLVAAEKSNHLGVKITLAAWFDSPATTTLPLCSGPQSLLITDTRPNK